MRFYRTITVLLVAWALCLLLDAASSRPASGQYGLPRKHGLKTRTRG